jgi:hypothetical protein
MVRDNDVQDTPPATVECAAYWCVVTDYAQMVNGSLHEARGDLYTFASAPDAPHTDMVVVMNSSVAARTSYGQEQNIYMRPETCRINQTTTSNAEDCSFRVSAQAQLGLQNFLSEGYFGIAPLLTGWRKKMILTVTRKPGGPLRSLRTPLALRARIRELVKTVSSKASASPSRI